MSLDKIIKDSDSQEYEKKVGKAAKKTTSKKRKKPEWHVALKDKFKIALKEEGVDNWSNVADR